VVDSVICREVESVVYCPGRWLAFSIGTVFLLAGVTGFLTLGDVVAPNLPFWFAKPFTGAFALLGGTVTAVTLARIIFPARVLHASPGVLPRVSKEPVICEGSVVYGRLTHELCEDVQGWYFRPAEHLRRYDKGCLFGFGVPFLVLVSGVLIWVLHSQPELGWVAAAVLGAGITAITGGSTFLLIGMMMRAGHRRLARLAIPRNGNDLELDSPEEVNPEQGDALKWIFLGDTKRRRLSISRESVVGVQLCPWKYVLGTPSRLTGWAVQGLLVLAPSQEGLYHRLPILLTGDLVSAARLMRRLADTLNVPYLFCADAEGWRVEATHAKSRSPLRVGGWQT
jgi:hypothetical protein